MAVADPQRLADMRVMATIVGDRPVYGFVPGSEALADAPRASYAQPTEAVVAVVTGTSPMTPAEGQNSIREKTLGAYAFTADVRDGDLAVFQMRFLGNGGPARDMTLLDGGSGIAGTRPLHYSSEAVMADGNWWIASLDAPMLPLRPDDALTMDKMHIAFFVLRDNGPRDRDAQKGGLAGQAVLLTDGPRPGNSGTTR